RVLVEGHLDGCASCRGALGELNAPGGAFLFSLPAEPPPDDLWPPPEVRVPASSPVPECPLLTEIPLPAGARRELPELGAVRWRHLPARGARFATLLRGPFCGRG